MELRHLRSFVAVAEELNFTRAATRLHVEQSPLSRTIKELESDLGAVLFERNSRGVRLTWAGERFLDDTRRLLAKLEQARANVKRAALGFRGVLRVALSDCVPADRLATVLANCRIDEPDVDIRLYEVPYSQQVKGLLSDLYDVGFSRSPGNEPGLQSQPVWHDELVAALPARHPLLVHRHIPLTEALRYPLILCHPDTCEGHYQQIERLLKSVSTDQELHVAEHAASQSMMKALVSAGYGLGLTCVPPQATCLHNEIIVRPLAGAVPVQTTYLQRPATEPSPQLARFVERATREHASDDHLG
ncbi:LysR family transcriptional regulator [Chitinimonas lacunae]|uniref:LysR family transcriptional regulator n=1 Tax=Chitinimonas lacunae TaxID=1963018 RepID=A0ABV8MUT9_9NEIS